MISKMILKSFDFQCDFDFQITTSKMILNLILNHLYLGELILILESSIYEDFAHLCLLSHGCRELQVNFCTLRRLASSSFSLSLTSYNNFLEISSEGTAIMSEFKKGNMKCLKLNKSFLIFFRKWKISGEHGSYLLICWIVLENSICRMTIRRMLEPTRQLHDEKLCIS